MTYEEIIVELEELKNDRGIKYYKQTFGEDGKYLGLGLTQLKKLAKKIKTNVELAKRLRSADYFEAQMLSFMIDDPGLYDLKKLEEIIEDIPNKYNESPLSYFTMVFAEFIISKSPVVKEFVKKYSKSKNNTYRFFAYSALNNLGKNRKIIDEYFEYFLTTIENNIQKEANNVKDAMNNSMLSWGQRSIDLNRKILKAYDKIGEIVVDYGETSCQTPNVPKILSSERIQKKIK